MRIIRSGVYRIICTETTKIYIGSSKDLTGRWNVHRKDLRRKKHCNAHLQNAWNKYGEDAFQFEILEECEPVRETLLCLEQRYIDVLQPDYNICLKAGSPSGVSPSAETREKIRNAHLGRKKGPTSTDVKEKISKALLGRKRTPEEIEKSKLSRIGLPVLAERRAKQSATMTGRKASAETLKKLSEARRGIKQSAEHIEKRTAAIRGRKKSAEAKEKMSAAKRGKTLTQEHRDKIAATCGSQEVKDRIRAGQQAAFIKALNEGKIAGIGWRKDKQKWRARFQVDGSCQNLGYFATKEEAIAARLKAQQDYLKLNTEMQTED